MTTEVSFTERLEDVWRIQSSTVAPEADEQISAAGFQPEGWTP